MTISLTDNKKVFRPSKELYDAVLGAFRAQGIPFANWCDRQGIHRENARSALHGIWRGPKADTALKEIIGGADAETVGFLLRKREEKDKEAA